MKYAVVATLTVLVVLAMVAFVQPDLSRGHVHRDRPTVVAGAVVTGGSTTQLVYRFWSDGQVDITRVNGIDSGCTFGDVCGQVVVVP